MVLMKGKPGKSDKKSWHGPQLANKSQMRHWFCCAFALKPVFSSTGGHLGSVVGVWLDLPTSAVRPTAHPPIAHLAFHQPAFQHLDKLKLST